MGNFKTGTNQTGHLSRRDFLETSTKTAAMATIPGLLSASIPTTAKSVSKADFDVIIKNGTIFDGTGNKSYLADIGITGNKISAIGTLKGQAGTLIDAKGLAVTPGFIDVHTHCDLTFARSGKKRYLAYVMPSWKGNYNYLYQGVTTVVTGNCGYGYTDTNFWFELVNAMDFGTNVYHLAPHGMIRQELFGKNQPGKLSAAQLSAMEKRVAEEMEKGAIGLSTGLEYAPGLLSDTDELIALANVAGRYGGIYATHLRNYQSRADGRPDPGVITGIKESLEIARQSELPVQISHLGAKIPKGNIAADQLFETMEKGRSEGIEVTTDQHPYSAGSSLLSILLPNEFKTEKGVKDQYRTKTGRQAVKKVSHSILSNIGADKISLSVFEENESYEGKSIQEIADIENRDPVDVFTTVVCADPAPMAVYFNKDADITREIMKHAGVITASDGWTVPKDMTTPHPRCYGTFSKRIKEVVMDNQIMSFGEMIHTMTGMPAKAFNMKGRGKIAEGYFADLAVFDVSSIRDRATYKDPHQYAEGIRHLFVNGTLSVKDGKATGDRGGLPLKRITS